MKIGGLQKVSTIDYPGEIACVVFLWGCNFRCGFCYNPDLVVRDVEGEFESEEVLSFLSKRMGKLDAVVITGGEPLLSLDLDFVRRVKAMGFKVKIDTNGSCPERLRELVDEELVDYVAMDVKGAKEDYFDITGVDVDMGKIEESMRIVDSFGKGEMGLDKQNEGLGQLSKNGTQILADSDGLDSRSEFRTTVTGLFHDVDRLRKMGVWMGEVCGGKPGKIFLQGFKRNEEGMIGKEFLKEKDVLESDVLVMKEGVEDLFGEVGVRV
ncbi:anaerobic ribonucleoside-triphosphate reductase activating protein [Methanococcoides sp. SA1]|nr:anaerobic ribonucleoside-triphosphate reductase activating protein [Methanococcoides sp. SA1]